MANYQPRTRGDFTPLEGSDDGARYHASLAKAFSVILKSVDRLADLRTYEALMFRYALERLIYTVEALRMKYFVVAEGDRGMLVDMGDSGFPGSIEFHQVETDAERVEKLLDELPALRNLRERLSDNLFQSGKDDFGTLSLLAQRTYLEMIADKKQLFLPVSLFEPELVSKRTDNGNTAYRIAWTSFDHKLNQPHIYTMLFEQSEDGGPVHEKGESHYSLMKTLKHFGSRAPEIGILATQIDEALPNVHPKMLRRITIESIATPQICENRSDKRSYVLKDLFAKYGTEKDVYLTFSEHTVVSKGQVRQGLLGFGQLREVFAIPQDDLELADKKASSINKFVVTSHVLIQHMESKHRKLIPANAQVFGYTSEGEVHAVRR
jgi:hypothetical protein